MKLTFKNRIISFLSALSAVLIAVAAWLIAAPATAVFADTGNITCASASGNYLNDDYISIYKIPTDMMTYSSNADGARSPLANAFDGNWSSYWETNQENAGQNGNNPSFLNAITVTFDQPVSIDSIVYASSTARKNNGHGYPVILNIYTANGGDLSLYGTCNSSATDNRVVFSLGATVTVTQIKFEFRKVNENHDWTATAKEICFLQPDNASANKILDLFDDYAQYSVKNEYKTSLSEIRSEVTDLISYESALKPLLDRADALVNGYLKKDRRREFSTDPNADNVIQRYGDLRSYAGNTLKMASFGINRQVLGVGGLKGQTITVYVEANAGDPLPSIAFNQIYGDWRSWQSTYSLKLGKNVFTFPNFITSNYTVNTTAGGAIHLINPYEPARQSANVKIYVEGGYLYPVFRKGDDVNSFRTELTAYYNKMQTTSGMCNITELVGDHFIHTVSATGSYSSYVTNSVSPQKNAEDWDNYIKGLLEFGGITFDPQGEHYNEKNLHLYTNFRMVQPWAGAAAFAAGDHIGYITFGEGGLIRFGSQGWGVAHEIGHALDVNGRTIGETTNNMWSKFALAYFENTVSRNFNAELTNNLTSDEKVATSESYFNTVNRYSYQIWWNIEACHHGYWGKLDNMYRYFDEAAALARAGATGESLTQTERMIYYSSLVVGEDLGYYFERCGFAFDDKDKVGFKVENASSAYKKLIAKAIEDGEITEKGFKYWYVDADQYYRDSTDGCYDSSSSVEIRDIMKTSSGYTLLLSEPDNSRHLGYEIMEYRNGDWFVIGFTYSGSFTDTTKYEDGYVPQYKIRGYDRGMGQSAESAPVVYEEYTQTGVCRIGENYYDSIKAAVAAASAGGIVYVCSDSREENIVIDKNLILRADPSLTKDVVITKSAGGVMFTVNGGVTFTIGAADDTIKLVLDGNSFSQNGTLIKVNGGTLRVYNAELRNNRNTDHGGAVFNTGNSAFTNVTMKNNSSSINGGAIANFSGGIVTLTDCTIIGNTASQKGGAITLDGRTALIRTVVTGNTAGDVGGALYILSSNNARYVSVEGGVIGGNKAGRAGSIFYIDTGIFRFEDSNSELQMSGEIYKGGGTTINVSTAMPDFSNVTFRMPSASKGSVLLAATEGFAFTEADVASVKVDSLIAYLGENGKEILLKPATAIVTLNVNGTNVTKEAPLGNFVLPQTADGIEEDKYISEWILNGVSYSAGDTVKISGDCTFHAELKTKFKVTLKYNADDTQTYYITPNTKFYLPVDGEFDYYTILGWNVTGGGWYAPSAGVTITADTVIEADMIKLCKVTLKDKDETTVSWHGYLDSFVLEESNAPEGKKFLYWDVNGDAYHAGETVTVTGDVVITAVLEELPGEGLSAGIIALIVIIVVLVVAGAAVAAFFILKKKTAAKNGTDKNAAKDTAKKTAAKSTAKDTPKRTAANNQNKKSTVKSTTTKNMTKNTTKKK